MWSRLGTGVSTPAQDRFKFKYIRLKSYDVDRTIDFYQSLGMTVDYQVEQTSSSGESTPIVAMSYRVVTGDPSLNVQLIFERCKKERPEVLIQDEKFDQEEQRKPIGQEYLVVYVHLVGRLVKRLMAKGGTLHVTHIKLDKTLTQLCPSEFEVALAPIDVAEVKVAIVRDPNGLDVRLMELTDSQLNETSNRKQIEDTIRFYELIFSHHRGKTPGGKKVTTLDMATPGSRGREFGGVGISGGGRKKAGAAATLRQAITQGQGFRLVDTEEFVIGLSHTTYHWLGNDLRSTSCTICFTERSVADGGTKEAVDRSESLLLGFGFEVPGIDSAVNQLRYEHRQAIEWVNDRFKIAGIASFIRFHDHPNNLFLELYATKPETPLIPKLPTANPADPTAPLTDTIPEQKTPSYAIDYNHLRGHARILSASAIYQIKEPNQDIPLPPSALKKEPPAEGEPKTLKAKTLLDARRDSGESLGESGETLNLSISSLYGKREGKEGGKEGGVGGGIGEGKKEKGKGVKVKFRLDRPKSLSAAW
ncbi:hypothetical protein HK097_001427 [Rhizophlyctis rosea]|uniref:Uncharacterized protein n=1 Tax=Rhizophlyctis rosea TaxID=64517 RepID=A0AAD5S6M2_9FUNG|nr:hypothetical protein HK097_001427 [Rhizophlyctis rosea]